MNSPRARLALFTTAAVIACRDPAAAVFPKTALGRAGRDWLAAHNRGEGHAVVHFTLENRGTATVTGAQTDSIVSAGVQFAKHVGPLVPVSLTYATDTAVAVVLRAGDGGLWTARFRPSVQPSLVKVAVEVSRTSIPHGGNDLGPDSAPR